MSTGKAFAKALSKRIGGNGSSKIKKRSRPLNEKEIKRKPPLKRTAAEKAFLIRKQREKAAKPAPTPVQDARLKRGNKIMREVIRKAQENKRKK